MRPRVIDLMWSGDIPGKLGWRGLSTDDALEVLERKPRFVWQRPKPEPRDDGTLRMRPRRIVMTGSNYAGRVLTFILEEPDDVGVAAIVTGWPAKSRDIASYRRAR